MSIEGGVSGRQQRLVCPSCGKVFFAWRPDELPGAKVKCYFCRHEFADEAAARSSPAPPAPAPPAPAETPLADAAAAETPPGPAAGAPPAASAPET